MAACAAQVHAEATKIAKETEDANGIAAQVAVELEKALPALQEAEAALNVLTKKDISELKVRKDMYPLCTSSMWLQLRHGSVYTDLRLQLSCMRWLCCGGVVPAGLLQAPNLGRSDPQRCYDSSQAARQLGGGQEAAGGCKLYVQTAQL